MVRSHDESSSEVKLSTDGSCLGFADTQTISLSPSVAEKNRPYTSLMTLLKERVLQRVMYGKSLKYFQLVDIVGEVDDPLKAIDMLIWAKKQHDGKQIEMNKHQITDVIAKRIIRDIRRNMAKQLSTDFTLSTFRKLSLLIQIGCE